MLSIVLDKPGQFTATDSPAPRPAPGEALVRVHRIGVCGTDLHAFAGKQPFFSYPRILGHELGVEVLDPGSDPHGLQAGDRCSVEPYINCGRCIACRRGKPNCCADIKVLGIGAHAVERAGIEADDFVLVIGAGPIGLSVIQFVQVRGATLAVMDMSESRLNFCRKQLGVKHTLAPGPDAIAQLRALGGGDLPTVVIDATGNPKSMAGTFDLPAPGGRIVFVGLFQGDVTFNDPNFHRRELTLLASRNALPGTFRDIIALIEAGKIDTTPWITHRFALEDTPRRFPEVAADPTGIKTVIEVPAG
jgi:threonine dehydrogenase-like Zn-dependent dehydrogenase